MRLGTCLALELAVLAGAVSGVWFGIGHAVQLAGDYVGAREAAAATRVPREVPPLERLPAARLAVAVPPPARSWTVFEQPDEVLLAPLAATPVTHIKPNKGGTSLSLRVEFASGAMASFKPEQIHPQSDPRREIAAYRIDRLLGIGHVAPAKPVKFALAELIAAAQPPYRTHTTTRITEEAIAAGEYVRGMVAWWIPEIRDATIRDVATRKTYRVDEPEGMRVWASYLQVGATIPPEVRGMVEQLATLVVFDVIIDNADRWSGGNTKVSPDGKTLYFMDNTLSFSHYTRGHENNLAPLRRIQVYPRALVTKLRALTREAIDAALDLGDDPAGLGPLLQDVELRAILSRRDYVLQHIDSLIAVHGEDAVLALP